MGILNITPDSFYDGDSKLTKKTLLSKIQKLTESDIIDIGCESSRPGADPISIDKEIKRLDKVIPFMNYFNNIKKVFRFFPTWELLPYENLSPLTEISGERLEILNLLQRNENLLTVVPVEAIMQCVIPRAELDKLTFHVTKGETFEREYLETCLYENGYARIPLVENRGEYSVRGDIVDIFPPTSVNPIRIEFFDDIVDSIREFDIGSQVSLKDIKKVEILPLKEVSPTAGQKEAGLEKISQLAKEQSADPARLKELIDKIQHLGNFAGMEHLAPFFYPQRETLFDYLSKDSVFVFDEEDHVRRT